MATFNGAFYDAIVDEADVFFSIIYLYLIYPSFVIAQLPIIIGLWCITIINRILGSMRHSPTFRLHLYSGKYSISLFHVFVLASVAFGINLYFFYITAGFLMLFLIEEFIILLKFKNITPDAGSIFLLKKAKP
jgi:hypothetical protein